MRKKERSITAQLERLTPLWWGEDADGNLDELTKHKWFGDWTKPLEKELARREIEAEERALLHKPRTS